MQVFNRLLILVIFLISLSAPALNVKKMAFDKSLFKFIKAESWTVAGQNIIVRGNIHIPFNDMEIYADQAVINIENNDFEASGNIRFLRWSSSTVTIKPEKLAEIQRLSHTLTEIESVSGDIWGKQQIKVKIKSLSDNVQANRISGNLASGYFRFDDFSARYATFVCRAKSAERQPDGVIEAQDAEISACSYLEHNNGHYAIGAKKIKLTPKETEFFGLDSIVKERGDYSVLIYNGVGKVHGIPVLWLPVFYKPKDFSPGLFSFQVGKDSDWGYYINMSKYFVLNEYPLARVRLHGDYYTNRGFGYGLSGRIVSEESRTDFFAYSIYDIRPYESDDYEDYRLKINHGRFDFRVSNITHITPRLDFRGAFEYASDLYFVRDFFSDRYAANPQPATFAAFEQQFDHFSASIYFRPRTNSFYTVSEKLPEVRLDIPRQEILNTNFYYQGDFDASYNRMQWIKFDYKHDRETGTRIFNKLKDYQAYRFDTTHFLYFPIRLDWLTIVPRAGFKMTVYSKSSDDEVTTNDLLQMFLAADPECVANYRYRLYDSDGRARVRSLGELGFEASTKLHNTWEDVRVPFMNLDGLRHIARPYVNYTYIGSPSVEKEHLLYFDDTDRIERQHFFRFGIENRLQTRSSDKSVRTWFSMENYWDLYLENAEGFGSVETFNRIGNFCTTLTASPIERLTITASANIDLGNNNGPMPEHDRRDRNVGYPGIDAKWLNRLNASLNYEIVDDVIINLSYTYNRPYVARSTFSMGSTLYQMDAGGFFDKFFEDYDEIVSAGITLPLTPDKRTRAAIRFAYDLADGSFSDMSFMLTRSFHCWEIMGVLSFSRDADDDDHGWETSFSVQARLLGLEVPLQGQQNDFAKRAANQSYNSDSGSGKWF